MLFHKKLIALLDARQRRQGVGIFFYMLFGVALEMVGIGLILPVMGLMTSPELLDRFALFTGGWRR